MKTFFTPKIGLLRTKVVFSHGNHTSNWDEDAKIMAKLEQNTYLQGASHSEFEPMWNRWDGRTTEM